MVRSKTRSFRFSTFMMFYGVIGAIHDMTLVTIGVVVVVVVVVRLLF